MSTQVQLFPSLPTATHYWIATISHDHVERGYEMGILQVCHGKRAPLARLHAGDQVLCYSPKTALRNGTPCQAFTGWGEVRDERVYQVEMSPGFHPFRRAVTWHAALRPAPIRPMLDALSFGRSNWGLMMRRGLFEIPRQDFEIIRAALQPAG